MLSAMALRSLIEGFLPGAMVRCFITFEEFMDDTPESYAHYFVSSSIFFEHVSFFQEKGPKTIVLTVGEVASLEGIPYLNTSQSMENILKSLVLLHEAGHRVVNKRLKRGRIRSPYNSDELLTRREVEILRLIVKGMISKDIAAKLGISMTTAITHRKNITHKLKTKSVGIMTLYAVSHGFISVDEL